MLAGTGQYGNIKTARHIFESGVIERGRASELAGMEELQGKALYYEEPDHAPASIITLATCDRRVYGKNGRFLVIAGKM